MGDRYKQESNLSPPAHQLRPSFWSSVITLRSTHFYSELCCHSHLPLLSLWTHDATPHIPPLAAIHSHIWHKIFVWIFNTLHTLPYLSSLISQNVPVCDLWSVCTATLYSLENLTFYKMALATWTQPEYTPVLSWLHILLIYPHKFPSSLIVLFPFVKP